MRSPPPLPLSNVTRPRTIPSLCASRRPDLLNRAQLGGSIPLSRIAHERKAQGTDRELIQHLPDGRQVGRGIKLLAPALAAEPSSSPPTHRGGTTKVLNPGLVAPSATKMPGPAPPAAKRARVAGASNGPRQGSIANFLGRQDQQVLGKTVACPNCGDEVPQTQINGHLDTCLLA